MMIDNRSGFCYPQILSSAKMNIQHHLVDFYIYMMGTILNPDNIKMRALLSLFAVLLTVRGCPDRCR